MQSISLSSCSFYLYYHAVANQIIADTFITENSYRFNSNKQNLDLRCAIARFSSIFLYPCLNQFTCTVVILSISCLHCYDFLTSSIPSSHILFPSNLLDIQGLLPQSIKTIKNKEGVHGAISFCFRSKGTPMESLVKGLLNPCWLAEHITTSTFNRLLRLCQTMWIIIVTNKFEKTDSIGS